MRPLKSSKKTSSLVTYRCGLTDSLVSVIAVHGLNPGNKSDAEHAFDTWRAPDGRLWLQDDLPRFVPGARVFIHEYNATVLYGKDRDGFIGKASGLLEEIRAERRGSHHLSLSQHGWPTRRAGFGQRS